MPEMSPDDLPVAPCVNTGLPEIGSTDHQDSSSTTIVSDDVRPANSYGVMKPYQVTMITIGGAIHTGLMIGAGSALTDTGPAPIIISYTFVGSLVYLVLCALGEVASWSPIPSTVAGHAVRFCDPALGFTLSWIYWLKYVVATPSQLTASALLISLWLDEQRVNSGIWITVFLAVIITANYFAAPFLGTYEMALAFLKIIVVLGLLVLSAILAFGGGPVFQQGFRYWQDTGAFGKGYDGAGWLGKPSAICDVLPSATFAYLGSEMVGMTLLHTQDPRRTTARAIKMTSYRIVVFNIVCIILVVLLIPCGLVHLDQQQREPDSKTTLSAFVLALQMARIPVLPHVLNACILLFALSAATFGLHVSIGTMYRMSLEKKAPACLSLTDRRGVPITALFLCSALATLAYLNISSDSKILFRYFVNAVSMFSILTWISILITHLSFERARKTQRVPDAVLAFKAPLGRFGSWIALVACIAISMMRIIVILDHVESHYTAFITSYLGVPLYLALLLGYKATTKCKRVDPEEASLFSHRTVAYVPEPGALDVGVQIALGRHKERVRRFVRRWVT